MLITHENRMNQLDTIEFDCRENNQERRRRYLELVLGNHSGVYVLDSDFNRVREEAVHNVDENGEVHGDKGGLITGIQHGYQDMEESMQNMFQ